MDTLTSSLIVTPVSVDDADVAALIERHHTLMRGSSSEEACHVLTVDQLLEAGCDVLACRAGSDLLAVGALKRLSADHAELKSMHTAQAARRRGAGRAVLNALLDLARSGGCTRVSLETGTLPHFQAAREMYRQAGFSPCAPFGDYSAHPESVFLSRTL